jgi:dUTPase
MIKFEKVGNRDLEIPEWNGFFFPLKNVDDINLWPNSWEECFLGLSVIFPKKYFGLIFPDSGLGRKGITLMNPSLISNPSGRENLSLILRNLNSEGKPIFIPKGTVIAQLIFSEYPDDLMSLEKNNEFQMYGTIP